METYTMTFVYEGEWELPEGATRDIGAAVNVLAHKLSTRELFLADFNWSGYYSPDHCRAYLKEPYCCGAVVEVHLALDILSVSSRDMIYEYCFIAAREGKLVLREARDYFYSCSGKKQMAFVLESAA